MNCTCRLIETYRLIIDNETESWFGNHVLRSDSRNSRVIKNVFSYFEMIFTKTTNMS